MFTGLVREVGKVASFEDGRLVVDAATAAEIGDSIAIDGVCLTVVETSAGSLAFDVVPETLSRVKSFGDRVNVEPALRAGDPLGGHQVQGHVDGTGTVASVETTADGVRIRIEAGPSCSATASRRDRSPWTASRSPSLRSTRRASRWR